MSIAELKSLLGSGRISEDEDIIKTYSDDWTGRYRGFARAVISPQSTDEVVEILKWCSTNQVGVVPQGGNTGMVGGSTPLNGELIISLRKMKKKLSRLNQLFLRQQQQWLFHILKIRKLMLLL